MTSTMSLNDVVDALSGEEPDIDAAAQRLGADALPLVSQLVQGADPVYAARAAYLAGVIGGAEGARIVGLAAASGDVLVRLQAAWAAGRLPSVPKELGQKLLADDDSGVRKVTLQSIGSPVPDALRAAVQQVAQNDAEPIVRDLAGSLLSPNIA